MVRSLGALSFLHGLFILLVPRVTSLVVLFKHHFQSVANSGDMHSSLTQCLEAVLQTASGRNTKCYSQARRHDKHLTCDLGRPAAVVGWTFACTLHGCRAVLLTIRWWLAGSI